jgi:tRNA nucleotidyltransferase (CCA-adding enzyme)
MKTANRATAGGVAQPRPASAIPPATRWEHFDHGADIGVRGWGLTKAAAFEQAALALTAVVTDPSRVAEHDTVHISCEADDDELLLAAWLNAVITEMSVRRMLFARFQVELRNRQLSGVATGERVSPSRHQPAVEVKGATYTALRVARCTDGSWMAQTVVDV